MTLQHIKFYSLSKQLTLPPPHTLLPLPLPSLPPYVSVSGSASGSGYGFGFGFSFSFDWQLAGDRIDRRSEGRERDRAGRGGAGQGTGTGGSLDAIYILVNCKLALYSQHGQRGAWQTGAGKVF